LIGRHWRAGFGIAVRVSVFARNFIDNGLAPLFLVLLHVRNVVAFFGAHTQAVYPRQREVSATVLFRDRQDAGRRLAEILSRMPIDRDAVVLALPRGGVPVAYEVAAELGLPLDVFVVRKVGVPSHEELAMGAVASGGTVVRNEDVLRSLEIDNETFSRVAEEEKHEVERRESVYREGPPLAIAMRPVILIDDGVATGSTMLAAARAVRRAGARRVTVAVPVAAAETSSLFKGEVDALVACATPEPFRGVGAWYDDFRQTTDEEVRELLQSRSSGEQQSR